MEERRQMVDLHYEDFTELTHLEVDRENSIYYAKNTADRNRNRDPVEDAAMKRQQRTTNQ